MGAAVGQVAVRFSVQDAEVVRQALEKLGADGQAALDKMNAAGKTPSGGLSAISSIIGDLKSRVMGLAVSIGPVGSALISMGPVGIVAATALGTVASALDRVSEGSKAFAAFAKGIRDLAEQTGFATPQVQALLDLLQQHGVDLDKSGNGLTKFAEQYAQARKGAGELYAELRRLNAPLAEQFASATSLAEALNILAAAEAKTDAVTQALLNKFAFGKGAAGFGPALLDLAGQGGLGAVTDAALKTGAAFEQGVIDKQAKAATEAERKARIVEQAWNEAYASIADRWKDFKRSIGLDNDNSLSLKVAIVVRNALGGADQGVGFDDLRKNFQRIQAEIDNLGTRPDAARANIQAQIARRLQMQQNIKRQLLEGEGTQLPDPAAAASAPLPKARPSDADRESEEQITNRLTRQLQTERARLGLLGDTASATEKLKAREDEINLARRTGIQISDTEAERLKRNADLQISASDIAIRTRLGVATAEERYAQTSRELNLLLDTGKISEQQRTEALALYRKELDETVRSEQLRKSYLPGLKQLEQDAGNVFKTLDQGGVDAINGITGELVNMSNQTVTTSEGFKRMGQSVITTIQQILYKMTVARGLSMAFQAAFSAFMPSSGPVNNPFGGVANPTFNADGDVYSSPSLSRYSNQVVSRPTFFAFAKGGAGVFGEKDPEAIMPLERGPDGRLGVTNHGGGGSMQVNIYGAPAGTTTKQSTDSNGNSRLDVMLKQAVEQIGVESIASGDMGRAITSKFGVKAFTGS